MFYRTETCAVKKFPGPGQDINAYAADQDKCLLRFDKGPLPGLKIVPER